MFDKKLMRILQVTTLELLLFDFQPALTVDKSIHDCVSKESKRNHIVKRKTCMSKTAQNSCEDVKP